MLIRISSSTVKTNEFNPFTISTTTTDIIQMSGVVEQKEIEKNKLVKASSVTNSLKIKKSY